MMQKSATHALCLPTAGLIINFERCKYARVRHSGIVFIVVKHDRTQYNASETQIYPNIHTHTQF